MWNLMVLLWVVYWFNPVFALQALCGVLRCTAFIYDIPAEFSLQGQSGILSGICPMNSSVVMMFQPMYF